MTPRLKRLRRFNATEDEGEKAYVAGGSTDVGTGKREGEDVMQMQVTTLFRVRFHVVGPELYIVFE